MATSIVGLGYVGLTLALKIAQLGENVYALEKKEDVVQSLLSGVAHISEPGIESILRGAVGKTFFPSTKPPRRGQAKVHILCVNTPLGAEGRPDFSPLRGAAREVSGFLERGDLVVVRSTVPPSTTRHIVLPEIEGASGMTCGSDFLLAVAPERTIEGNAIAELGRLPQIIGGFDEASAEAAAAFFRRLGPKIRVVSSMEAAEMTKLLDNSYRYMVFAIGNELGLACESLGLDAREVIEAANWQYPRNDIKLPGAGVGGGCLPKDISMLAECVERAGLKPRMLTAAKEVNEGMPLRILDYIKRFHEAHGISRKKSKVLILGFAFKGRPEVNDTRRSPGGYLSRMLLQEGFNVFGYDPAVNDRKIAEFGATPCGSPEEGFQGATCVVTMNDNPRWSKLDLERLIALQSNSSIVIDGWKVLDEVKIKRESVFFKRLGDGRGEALR